MLEAIKMVFDFMYDVFRKLGSIMIVDFNGQSFNFTYFIFGGIIVSMLISLFWKGGKG